MLIYCNNLKLVGMNSEDDAFSSIIGWLRKTTKNQTITKSDLQSGKDFEYDKFFLRCLKFINDNEKLYSIRLSHPDRDISGREWSSEIGLKVLKNAVEFSIVIETFERSTLVTEIPESTRPFLISYLQKNCSFDSQTIGFSSRKVEADENKYSLRGFKEEVLKHDRNYPIVLISKVINMSDNNIDFDPKKLQKHLFGLAQVIELDKAINSYELEEFMGGSHLCAWDGAINIIFPVSNRGHIPNKLLSRKFLEDIISEDRNNLFRAILSNITHYTNIKNKNHHLSANDIKIEQLKNQRLNLRRKLEEVRTEEGIKDTAKEYKLLAEDAYDQLERQEQAIFELKKSHSDEQSELQNKIDYLENRVDSLEQSKFKDRQLLISYGSENNFYDNEILKIVISALNLAKDEAIKNTRRYDILNDIVTHNCQNIDLDENLISLKKGFKGYQKMNKKIKDCISGLNLIVTEEGNHYKMKFKNDERYSVSFAKTPSDNRAGDNIVRDIKRQFL